MNDNPKDDFIDEEPSEQGGDDDGAADTPAADPDAIPTDAGDPGVPAVEGQQDPGDLDDVPEV